MKHACTLHKLSCMKIVQKNYVSNLKVKFHLRKAKWKCCNYSAQAQSNKTMQA